MDNYFDLKLLAPAKINISLYVLFKRDDGYHQIISYMVPVTLFDRILVRRAGEGVSVSCGGIFPAPEGEKNIVYRAAREFFDYFGLSGGVKVLVEKYIPSGAGLGGGSSDAAAMLKALSILYRGGIDFAVLREISARIGSDVPFFIESVPSRVSGRGEIVERGALKGGLNILIVKPDVNIGTAGAYDALGKGKNGENSDLPHIPLDIDGGKLAYFLHNDFENSVFPIHPEIRRIKEDLIRLGAEGALMSGSGSALFGLFDGKEVARSAEERLSGGEGLFVELVENF